MESPCIKVCVIDPGSNLCTGCLRTLSEIAQWSVMPSEERNKVMAEIGRRRTLESENRTGAR